MTIFIFTLMAILMAIVALTCIYVIIFGERAKEENKQDVANKRAEPMPKGSAISGPKTLSDALSTKVKSALSDKSHLPINVSSGMDAPRMNESNGASDACKQTDDKAKEPIKEEQVNV